MSITVNEMELADEIASALMDERYLQQPWMEEDPDSGDFVVKDGQYREEYDLFLEEAEKLIKNCEEK